jgi:hypothetical protein
MNNTDYDEKYCTDWLIRGARNSLILFINHLKKENKIVLPLKDDIATMDPYEMKYHLKTLYMQYLTAQSYGNPGTTVTTYAYKHCAAQINQCIDKLSYLTYNSLKKSYQELEKENIDIKAKLKKIEDRSNNIIDVFSYKIM